MNSHRLFPVTTHAPSPGVLFCLANFLPGAACRWHRCRAPRTAHVHGHCHQKSFSAFAPALATLRQVPDLVVTPIVSSCCGMAGAFGYQEETQEMSRTMAEAGLLPALRDARAEDLIIADGTSCRQQIRDLAGREAVHSVRVLDLALASRLAPAVSSCSRR